MASLRERHLKTIVAVLGAAVRRGLSVDEDDFHHVMRDALEVADAESRLALGTITWDEVRERLPRPPDGRPPAA